MSKLGSISQCIHRLKNGEYSAANFLWERFNARMQGVADQELGNTVRTVSDEEDVVAKAFAAFLRRTDQGAYAAMENRDDLWRLLAKITRTYAWQQNRFFRRLRRRMSRNYSIDENHLLRQLASKSPPAELVASCEETLRRLLEKLNDQELQEVALARMRGLNNREIAQQQGRSVRTIERRLRLIKEVWLSEFDSL